MLTGASSLGVFSLVILFAVGFVCMMRVDGTREG
jgi:MFS-type transporter involved in bile tolerance (Atg22 family)